MVETQMPHREVVNMATELSLTRAQRIRAAMFPETLPADVAIPTPPSSALGQLAVPSQMLRIAISNLIAYQHDAAVTTRAIPELRLLLTDHSVAGQAAGAVHMLTHRDAARAALAADPLFVRQLVVALGGEAGRDAAGALHQLSKERPGLLAIFSSEGIPALLALLETPDRKAVQYALSTLHNLLQHQPGAVYEVNQHRGTAKISKLIGNQDWRLLAIVIQCLCILAHGNDVNKGELVDNEAYLILIDILTTKIDYEKLLWVSTRLLKIISSLAGVSTTLVNGNVIGAIGHQFGRKPTKRIKLNCLCILANISDGCSMLTILDNIIRYMCSLLQHDTDMEVTLYAASFLSNVTSNAPWNKEVVYGSRGVEALFQAIVRGYSDKAILEAAVVGLRHITGMHEKAAMAQSEVGTRERLDILVKMLSKLEPESLIVALVGLFRHLSLLKKNHDVLNDLEVISIIRPILENFELKLYNEGAVDYKKLLQVGHAILFELEQYEAYDDEESVMLPVGTNNHNEEVTYSTINIPSETIGIEMEPEEDSNEENEPNSPSLQTAWVDTNL